MEESKSPNHWSSKPRTTICVILLLLAAWPAAKVYQSHRMEKESEVALARQRSEIERLWFACRTFSADLSDVFPRDFQELIDEGYLEPDHPLTTGYTASGVAEPYIYRPGYIATEPAEIPLILSPESPKQGWRVIGYVGGEVKVVKISNEEVKILVEEEPTLPGMKP